MLRFFAIFAALLALLFIGELSWPAQRWLVQPWTALLAEAGAALLQWFDPGVIAEGKVLRHAQRGAGVAIEAGCNGVEACLMLLAALLAWPASWRARLIGIAAGFAAIQFVNLLRIITLFYLAGWDADLFRFAHLYLWQALIMLDVLAVWLLWLRWVARNEAGRPAAAAAASSSHATRAA